MSNIATKMMALLLCLLSAAAFSQVPPVTAPPPTRLVVADARLPVRLAKVQVRAEVLGSTAHTRIEMVFYNPNDRVLQGELQFPLLENQVVSGFALDIAGELRQAVPVEKVKGRQAFEELSRAKIDPALLEKTAGNYYKLRVYPLPAKGTRTVVVETDEALPRAKIVNSHVYYTSYQLPLQFSAKVGQLEVAVHNGATPARHSAMAVLARLGAEHVKVAYEWEHDARSGSVVSFSRKNYSGNSLLKVDFPNIDPVFVATETRDDQSYFYAEVAAPAEKSAAKFLPKKMGLVWDASGSGAARDHGREYALLDAYFRALSNVEVQLLLARDRAEPVQVFSVKNGNWSSLRAALEATHYDGASCAAALSPPAGSEINLLFSDGLTNYGSDDFEAGDAPLYAINSAPGADLARLRHFGESSGGRVLDLLGISPLDAVDRLTHRHSHLAGMYSNGATELVSDSIYPASRAIRIAGILGEPEAVVTLDWITAQGQHHLQQVKISNSAPSTLAAHRFAALQLARLEGDYNANRAAIRRIGNRFGMATRETSLIVLDRVEDYVRYEISPPRSLRAEYEVLLAKKNAQKIAEGSKHLDAIAERFAQKKLWWERIFPQGDIPMPAASEKNSGHDDARRMSREPAAAQLMAMSPPPVAARPVAAAPAPAPAVRASPAAESSASIALKKWEPDSAYARRLKAADMADMYAVYLDERPSYVNSTAFFLDAADIFIERGQGELGLRILSNLAEMDLENRQILRILAYRLLQAKEEKLALPILQQVLLLAPDEPQSWRDLGLAYAEDGKPQLAVDNLWEVVAHPWHDRFPDIELVALAELNAVVARSAQPLDVSRIDSRLLTNLSLDLRAVLSWDADNTDIDLWVTDPNNEKVYFAHRLSYQGGTISRDFTRGYGPEEFSLRHAKPGKYKVEAQFYGHSQQVVSGATTLMLRLSTGFGTPEQQDRNVVMRLSGQGAVVEVGTFEVKPH